MKTALDCSEKACLAVIIEDLCEAQTGRTEAWILQQQNPDVSKLTAGFFAKTFPDWFGRAINFITRISILCELETEAKRIHTVLLYGVEQGLLATEVREAGTYYTITPASRNWSHDQYQEIGRTHLLEVLDDSPLTGACELCKALAGHDGPMTAATLQDAAFPAANVDSSGRVATRVMQQEYNATIPTIFARSIAEAEGMDWINEADQLYYLTPKGREQGAVYFDDMR